MKYCLTTLALFILFCANSQERLLKGKSASNYAEGAIQVRLKDYTDVPNHILFEENKMPGKAQFPSLLNKYYGVQYVHYGVKKSTQDEDKLGFTHTRYTQTYKGIPIDLATYILHEKSGRIHSLNGEFLSSITVSNIPTISKGTALQNALDYIDAISYKWQIASEEKHIKLETNNPEATYYPNGELVYINENGNLKNPHHLAYKFDIYSHNPIDRKNVYVDAHSGNIIWTEDKLLHIDSKGKAHTGYSGIQTIITDSSASGFVLRESGRGNGIETYDMNMTTNYGSAVDFHDSDNVWNNINVELDQYATDAHWGAEMTYDYFFLEHGRNSIDGNGFKLKSYVHFDLIAYGYNSNVNAFWDGQRMTYGDGSSTITPLTTMDISGHEISHGLTSNTSSLVYQDEPGALNESFSDIFGTAIEFYSKPLKANWSIGSEIGSSAMRSMKNPGNFGDPDTYKGQNWYTGTDDNGGVHTNSGVQNHWFYLLCAGDSGVNDRNDTFNVTGIGVKKGGEVAFRNNTVYLGRNSDYADARYYSILSAVDLYGGCTPEVESVTNAWYACGVGAKYQDGIVSDFKASLVETCEAPFEVQFSEIGSNGFDFKWEFGDGSTSTERNPIHTYNSTGTYSVTLVSDGLGCGIDTLTLVDYIDIDTLNTCSYLMPSEGGSLGVLSACEGKVYDSGGPFSFYGTDEESSVIISPYGAATVDLMFKEFGIESGFLGSCSNDYLKVYDGPDETYPLIGNYCNNNLPPDSIRSTRGSLTLVFRSNGNIQREGFEVVWNCNQPNQLPQVDFEIDVDSTCSGLVAFKDMTLEGPTDWYWDFGDGNISTEQNPKHIYLSGGKYSVKLVVENKLGADSIIKSDFVNVFKPTKPMIVKEDTLCNTKAGLLQANGDGTLKWYDKEVGGTKVGEGSIISTGPLDSTSSFWVSNNYINPSQTVGKPDNAGGGRYFSNDQHLKFDVFAPVEIVSTWVFADSDGDRIVELRDNTGNIIESKTIYIESGPQQIQLGFEVEPGTDYQLGVDVNGTVDLYRNDGGTNFPYELPGLVTITRSSANTNPTGYYYFFYEWDVREQDCRSERIEVVATVLNCTSVEENLLSDGILIFPNPAQDVLNISTQEIIKQVSIYSLEGKLVLISNNKNNIQIGNLAPGLYSINVETAKGNYIEKLNILR